MAIILSVNRFIRYSCLKKKKIKIGVTPETRIINVSYRFFLRWANWICIHIYINKKQIKKKIVEYPKESFPLPYSTTRVNSNKQNTSAVDVFKINHRLCMLYVLSIL